MPLEFESHELLTLSDTKLFNDNPSEWWEYWYTLTDEIDNRGLHVQRDFMRLMYNKHKIPMCYGDNGYYRMVTVPHSIYINYSSMGCIHTLPREYFNLSNCRDMSCVAAAPHMETEWMMFASVKHMAFYDAMFKCYSQWGTKIQAALEEIL